MEWLYVFLCEFYSVAVCHIQPVIYLLKKLVFKLQLALKFFHCSS